MKTYVKQIIAAIVISTAIVCLGYGVNGFLKAESEGPVTLVDKEGSTYLVVYDEESNTYVAVTDSDGKVFVAATDANGKVSDALVDENGNYYYVSDVNATDLPVNTTKPAVSIDVTNDPSGYIGEVDSTQSSTAATTKEPSSATTEQNNTTAPNSRPQNTTAAPEPSNEYLADRYKKLFEGGTYLMEFTTNDATLSNTPVRAAFKNGNILMNTTIESLECTMLYLVNKKESYLVLPAFKKYCKLPEELMETMSSTSGAISDGEYTDVKVTNVIINGETLICEEYSSTDGSTIKYYFSGDTLVRRDRIEADGLETCMYFTKITSDVPDSTFEVPKNYGYLNLSWLDFMFDS